MANEEVTIGITDELISVYREKLAGSRLKYQACGVDIYTIGQSEYHHSDCVRNIAMQICLERHIPVISLREVKTENPKFKTFETGTRRMF